jgi:hypothetical protein
MTVMTVTNTTENQKDMEETTTIEDMEASGVNTTSINHDTMKDILSFADIVNH